MRDTLMEEFKRFSVHHSIKLPDGSTEIDLLLKDESSSTVLIVEMKWYRKSSTYRERLRADKQFLDGVHRQLRTIKQFCRERPMFLQVRTKLNRNLSEYEHVHYMLIAQSLDMG
jgi:hypothetical protein